MKKKILKNYSNFLCESDNELINKNQQSREKPADIPLILSPKLKERLNGVLEIKDSNISKRLLEFENNKEHLFDISYIDVCSEDDMVSYIQTPRYWKMKNEGASEQDIWSTEKYRVKTKIGKFISKIFGNRFDSKSIEKFINKFKSIKNQEEKNYNFELIEGEEIRKWFNVNNIENGKIFPNEVLSNYNYLDLFAQNPNQIKLLILKNETNDKILGKSLIWILSKPENEIFMDKIFVINQELENLFIRYSKKNQWLRKSRQVYGNSNIVKPDGKIENKFEMIVKLDNYKFKEYPYVDTFRYLYMKDGVISTIYHKNEKRQIRTLNDVTGKWNEFKDEKPIIKNVTDEMTGEQIPIEKAIWCEEDKVFCNAEDAVKLVYNGEYCLPKSKNVVYSEYTKKRYFKKDCVFSKILNTWVWNKYAIEFFYDKEKTNKDYTHLFEVNKTVGEINGEYYNMKKLKKISTTPDLTGNKIISSYEFVD